MASRAGGPNNGDQCPRGHTGFETGSAPGLMFLTVRRCSATVTCNAPMQSASDACGAGMSSPHEGQRSKRGRPGSRSGFVFSMGGASSTIHEALP